VRSSLLFVRTDTSPLAPRTLDRLLRSIALRAGVSLPVGAAAHAFRHHYGVTPALRGVPQAAISQLMGTPTRAPPPSTLPSPLPRRSVSWTTPACCKWLPNVTQPGE